MTKFNRTAKELEGYASMFWPPELSKQQAELSVIPVLVQSQDDFIAILSIAVETIEDFFGIVRKSKMSANLFLKHLVVLSDVGGEVLRGINQQFTVNFFPDGLLEYLWGKEKRTYTFQELPLASILTNDRLGVSGKKILDKQSLTPLQEDIIALLLLGKASTKEHIAEQLAKCEISEYLGKPGELSRYIKQRYIWVSRITGGSQANDLGQLAQDFVRQYLEQRLKGKGFHFNSTGGRIPDVTHVSDELKRAMTFDLTVSNKHGKYVAVETSFQVTTNSTIERKAGQARPRFEQISEKGHHIAYVIDGAGNFQRQSALSTICDHSHCTVAFSKPELDILAKFITKSLGES